VSGKRVLLGISNQRNGRTGSGLAALLFVSLSLLTSHLSPLVAQSATPAKVAKSVERIFGPGIQLDTLKVDTASVLGFSKGGTLMGFARVRNVKG
jgi:hypothetical protein